MNQVHISVHELVGLTLSDAWPMLQDPIIFSGTVRHNLDPIGRVDVDADLWAAVRSAGLLETLQSLQVRDVDSLHVLTRP